MLTISYSQMREGEVGDMVMPAVPGEFYGYATQFTPKRPLYVFMKCKSNKQRTLESAFQLGSECNLVFQLEDLRICSVKTAHDEGVLGHTDHLAVFSETWIGEAGITADAFYGIRLRKDTDKLVRVV